MALLEELAKSLLRDEVLMEVMKVQDVRRSEDPEEDVAEVNLMMIVGGVATMKAVAVAEVVEKVEGTSTAEEVALVEIVALVQSSMKQEGTAATRRKLQQNVQLGGRYGAERRYCFCLELGKLLHFSRCLMAIPQNMQLQRSTWHTFYPYSRLKRNC